MDKKSEIEAWGLSMLWDAKDEVMYHSPGVMKTKWGKHGVYWKQEQGYILSHPNSF